MDETIKAKLIAMYWEAWDKSNAVINYQRGNNDIPHQYHEGYSDGLSDVFELLGIDAESDIPAPIKADRDIRHEKVRVMYAELGLDLDAMSKPQVKQESPNE